MRRGWPRLSDVLECRRHGVRCHFRIPTRESLTLRSCCAKLAIPRIDRGMSLGTPRFVGGHSWTSDRVNRDELRHSALRRGHRSAGCTSSGAVVNRCRCRIQLRSRIFRTCTAPTIQIRTHHGDTESGHCTIVGRSDAPVRSVRYRTLCLPASAAQTLSDTDQPAVRSRLLSVRLPLAEALS